MAQFQGMKLTNNGMNLIAKALIGKQLKFTRAWAGDGILPEGVDITELEDIIARRREMKIQNLEIPPYIGTAKITAELTNQELVEGFFIREIGLFALDPDTNQEILYGYTTAGNTADFIPGQDGPDIVHYVYALTAVIGQAKDVTAIFAENPLHVTYIELNAKVDDVLKYVKAHDEALQQQINLLANADILNSIKHYQAWEINENEN